MQSFIYSLLAIILFDDFNIQVIVLINYVLVKHSLLKLKQQL